MFELQLLGGGRMGEALLGGLVASGSFQPADLAVVERVPGRRTELEGLFPGVTVLDEPAPSRGLIAATKPADITAALAAASGEGLERVLSIAAGVSLEKLSAAVGDGVAVVRAMPNTPSLVGAGAAAICAGPSASEADLVWAESILGAVGTVVRVPEASIDAATGVSGSGPAYIFLIAEAMIDAGVLAGLPRATADQLVRQTILGAARLMSEGGEDPQVLRAAVTSPGGTTAAAVQVLEQRAVRAAVVDAVAAAAARSQELDS